NFALQLVHYLNLQGLHYHWTWAYNHIGYSKYHEGVAILSLKPLKPEDILVSAVDDETDYHTRRALVAETTLNDKVVTVVSLHFSWFEKGFAEEWKR
ncbi:exonuclease/endonuclease/phosphatase family protein, partial [Streptococcus suis]|nr:exodeoxyribonuclease III [Streptococcus suis]